eukprot:2369736-Pyramimonas_sp.AAC.1
MGHLIQLSTVHHRICSDTVEPTRERSRPKRLTRPSPSSWQARAPASRAQWRAPPCPPCWRGSPRQR